MSDEGKPEAEPQSATPPASPPVEPPDTGYTAGGVPTFESVREKIETRYGTSIGASELDAESPEGRTIEEQMTPGSGRPPSGWRRSDSPCAGNTPQNDDT
jgi:hypothetical protein